MLRHLHIQNLALLREVSIDFQQGMTVLTGESGAGKSLVLDALGLLAGMRATPSLVRSGADRAAVEAIFEYDRTSPVTAILKEFEIESEESGELIIRREVLAAGRSRAWINGRLAPVSQLGKLVESLVDFCGQHDQHKLLEPKNQRDFFDDFAGAGEQRREVSRLYRSLKELREELEELRAGERDREQRCDFYRFQLEELEAAGIQPGELSELENEAKRLGNLGELCERSGQANCLLADGDGENPSALNQLAAAISTLESLHRIDSSVEPILNNLKNAKELLSETSYELADYISGLEVDPEKADEVNSRCAELKRILRKHGATEEEAIARIEELQREIESMDQDESRDDDLEKRISQAEKELHSRATELSATRKKAAPRFLRSLKAVLKGFAMPKARIDLHFASANADGSSGPGGMEDVEIRFSANEGEELQPLQRVASGGELSRVMLALRTMEARRGAGQVLIFDEVDTGISGQAVRRIAERLAALGETHQVLCVTHNPSVASAAASHLLVEKKELKGRTESFVEQAEGIRRQGELARLLDGGKMSERGMALAEELMQVG